MISQSSFKKIRLFSQLIFGKVAKFMVQRVDGTFAESTRASLFNLVNAGVGKSLVAASTLTAEDSGSTLLLGHATGFTTTLPPLADSIGAVFRFQVSVAPTTGNQVILAADVATITGALVDGEAATVAEQAADEDQVNVVANSAIIGDWVELSNPNGTVWMLDGFSSLAASITATT
jgi:hypothetical protein